MRRLVANETAGAGKKHALTSAFMTNRKIPGIPGSPLFFSPDERSPCFIFIFFLFPHLFLRGSGVCRGDSCHFPMRWRRWGVEEMCLGEVVEEFIHFPWGEKMHTGAIM